MARKFLEFEKMWWACAPYEVHDDLFALMRLMDERQEPIRKNNLINFKLYGNANVGSIGQVPRDNGPEHRYSINLCQNMVDTIAAKIGADLPNTSFLTEGGDDSLQRKAKKLEKFSNGIKYHTDYDDKRQQIFTDACVLGTGCLKIYPQNGKIQCDRILIDSIKVDDIDGMYGTPRNLYDDRYVSRETLAETYPKSEKKILKVDVPSFKTNFIPLAAQYYKAYQQVRVVEAYRLPDHKGKNGRHVICVENATLIDEPFTQSRFPHVFFRSSPRLVGFFGQGTVERARGKQLELNKLIRTYQTAIHLGAIPYVIFEVNSKASTKLWSNENMRHVKYQGNQPPQIVAPQVIPPDLFNAINWIYEKAYEEEGISMMAAQAKKPEGLDSGKAIREYHDIQSERMMSLGKRWERFDQDCAKRFVDAGRHLDEQEDEGFSVCCVNKKFLETINWKDVNLDEEDYILQTFPVSGLSRSYAGRLADVQEMLQAGLITPESGRKLLNFPDLEADLSLENGPYDCFKTQIDDILEEAKFSAPEPFQLPYLPMGIKMFGGAYMQAKASKVPENKLELLRDWINQAMRMAQPPAPPPMPPMPNMPEGQGMMPQANPMPTPQSNLIPNVPNPEALQ